jgi:hypothetical protein
MDSLEQLLSVSKIKFVQKQSETASSSIFRLIGDSNAPKTIWSSRPTDPNHAPIFTSQGINTSGDNPVGGFN